LLRRLQISLKRQRLQNISELTLFPSYILSYLIF
jgi:hypothetical protein